jgi:hypothetical protein
MSNKEAKQTIVYVKVDDRDKVMALQILSPESASTQEVVDLFCNAVDIPESCRKDVVLKLTNEQGHMLPISPRLPGNTHDKPYLLCVKMLNGAKIPATVPLGLCK